MEFTVQDLIQGLLPEAVPAALGYALAAVLVAVVVLSAFVAPLAGVTSWLERRVWARMQSRVGPNRVGPQGVLQWLADGIQEHPERGHHPDCGRQEALPAGSLHRLLGVSRGLRRDTVRQLADCRGPQHRYPLPPGHHLPGGGGHPDGGLVVQQQMVAVGGDALGCADRQLRDPRGARGADGGLPVGHPQHAGDHRGPGMGPLELVHLLQPLHPGGLLPVLHRGSGRG